MNRCSSCLQSAGDFDAISEAMEALAGMDKIAYLLAALGMGPQVQAEAHDGELL